MHGAWVACLGLVLLAHYCCSGADNSKPSHPDVAHPKGITPTVPTKKVEASKRARNYNPFLPFYNQDYNEQNQPDFARNTPPYNPAMFNPFNPFMYFNPAMLMMMLNPQQNPFNPDILRGGPPVTTVRTVTSTSVIQSTIVETTTQTTVTPFIETTTIVIPSTSTSTIVIPVYSTEMFIVTATSTSTIVVPEYSTTTIVAVAENHQHQHQHDLRVNEGDFFGDRRNNRQARVPKHFKTTV